MKAGLQEPSCLCPVLGCSLPDPKITKKKKKTSSAPRSLCMYGPFIAAAPRTMMKWFVTMTMKAMITLYIKSTYSISTDRRLRRVAVVWIILLLCTGTYSTTALYLWGKDENRTNKLHPATKTCKKRQTPSSQQTNAQV